ncbi:hypothetical protein COLO4_15388 [Corchorus olitorius]|uniref:LRAT domain-containing protein n=1 Tax=Corchorus olitorius TaxID=93759 RepID=A0A1R3JNE9_9ROSI|nr:hypothetical protein COLO4_15388 [Corchorus olitorius]
MQKVKQKIEKGKRIFTHRKDSCRVKPGDHIYSYRGFGSYSHHGIYVSEDCVIHFIPTESHDTNGVSGTEEEEEEESAPCTKCGYQHNVHLGVVKSCLDCFLSHGAHLSESLHVYEYEESSILMKLKRAGSCSTSKSFSPETVVKLATALHKENCFGLYNLVDNNCEHFATFCKTGIRSSEQVHSVMNKPIIPILVNLIKNATSTLANADRSRLQN